MTKFDIFLTRLRRYFSRLDRVGIMWYVVIFGASVLIITLFSFSVINTDFYTKLANAQQKAVVRNPESRGTISSSASSLNGVVAVSTDLGSLSIDPGQTGSREKLLEVLSDAIIFEFCSHKTREECVKNIGNYVRSEEVAKNIAIPEAEIKIQIKNYLLEKMDSPIESVFLGENLSDNLVEEVNKIDDKALFFVSNNLYVNPTLVTNSGALAATLSPILNKKVEEILPTLTVRKKRHLEIIRKMSVGTREMIEKARSKNIEAVSERIKKEFATLRTDQQKSDARQRILEEDAIYPFIKIDPNLVRYYPEGYAMGQITGFVDGEGKGRNGIEGFFEKDLQGDSPTQLIVKDQMGRPIRDYVSSGALSFQNSANISLTIDRSVQKEVMKKLENAVKAYSANKASAIVTDPKTGAIIAMATYPSYDPNQFASVFELEEVSLAKYPNPFENLFNQPMFVIDSEKGVIPHNIDGKLVKLRDATDDEIKNNAIVKFKYKNGFGPAVYQNSAIADVYEPGSVMKSITVAIGLDTGEITPNMTYYDDNEVWLEGMKKPIANSSASHCMGRHTFTNALTWSCNIGMIEIVDKVGKSLFDSYMRDFGFGSRTNITLDGENAVQIAPYEKWPRVQFFTMSFGQGISVNMLQMASAYNVLANGGIYMKPYIVESITYPNGKKIDNAPMALRRVIKEETSKQITAMMIDGVKRGWAKEGAVPGYAIAGKTGTSQIPYRGVYEDEKFGWTGHTVTSYGGYAPAYNPKFVLLVVMDRPRNNSDSSKNAAFLWKDIAEYLLTYYKVPKWQ